MPYEPCDACARHVRDDAPRCPFCDAPIAGPQRRETSVAPERLLRRAILALEAVLAAAGCRSTSPEVDTSRVEPSGAPITTPPPDVVVPPPRETETAIVAPYGAPPLPAGFAWKVTASATTLPLARRGAWRLRVSARNTSTKTLDPGSVVLSFRVNGRVSPEADPAFGNGARVPLGRAPRGRVGVD
ncbi:MAG: hypothetical protein U0325_32050 [Polyangiales bacterium]